MDELHGPGSLGVVLCGGRSSRMGRPKAWLPWQGQPLLTHVVRVVAAATDSIAVVAAPDQELPDLPPEVEVLRDTVAGQGPLGGLLTALEAFHGRAEVLYLSSCDVPFLQAGFVRLVLARLRAGASAVVVPQVGGRLHPLAAAYHIRVRDEARRFLSAGRRRMSEFLAGLTVHVIEASELAAADAGLLSLWNINTPEDYEAARRHAVAVASSTADPVMTRPTRRLSGRNVPDT